MGLSFALCEMSMLVTRASTTLIHHYNNSQLRRAHAKERRGERERDNIRKAGLYKKTSGWRSQFNRYMMLWYPSGNEQVWLTDFLGQLSPNCARLDLWLNISCLITNASREIHANTNVHVSPCTNIHFPEFIFHILVHGRIRNIIVDLGTADTCRLKLAICLDRGQITVKVGSVDGNFDLSR